jgi:glycosyltransferase involved in cell wall biosynthesis
VKVLQVSARYYPSLGGIQEHVRKISERLTRKYDVTVATTDPSGKLARDEIVNEVKVRRFKSWAPGAAYYFSRELKRYLMQNSPKFDLVHAHGYHAFPALYAAQTKVGNKFVFTPHYHGAGHTILRDLLHKPYKLIAKKILDRADFIVCVSSHERNVVVERLNADDKKVVIIPNGIDQEEFKNLRRNAKDRKVILCVGRLEKYKGIGHLIKVLPHLDDRMRLEVVGDGPHREALTRLVQKLRVQDRVKFYHNLPRAELVQKYADAGVYVSLSEHEAYGITVAEALAAGTPCIVANTSAMTEWIDNRNCFGVGYPVRIGNLKEMINEVSGRVVDQVWLPTWDYVVEKLAELYESLSEV